MFDDNEAVVRKVVEHLAKMASPKARSVPINLDTEIYLDLGIYGDEIVDLIVWLKDEFGIAGVVNPFVYAPHEFPFAFPFLALVRAASRAMGIGARPQYKSLAGCGNSLHKSSAI